MTYEENVAYGNEGNDNSFNDGVSNEMKHEEMIVVWSMKSNETNENEKKMKMA